jgi:hypothetical protein
LIFANGDETTSFRGARRGRREEIGIEIGEVETVLGEVRQTLRLVPYGLPGFSYTKTETA